jgi:hypothetical protein
MVDKMEKLCPLPSHYEVKINEVAHTVTNTDDNLPSFQIFLFNLIE